ncbi:MAG: glutathione S-transferase family protein [Myxococcota bacterium]
MILYGFGAPSRATRVAWALEEAGADWSYVAAWPSDPRVRELHPLGKLPILVDGELVLTESLACCTYVADQHPDKGLTPAPGTIDRARYLQWGSFLVTELEQPLWTKAKHRRILPQPLRVDVGPAVEHDFNRAVTYLSGEIGDRMYLLGDRFTILDLIATHCLRWARSARFGELLPDNLAAYEAFHAQRPALARATAREAQGATS